MTIDKAIEILTDQASKGFHFPDQERKEASKLGVEALNEIKEHRESSEHPWYLLLPGETRE